MTGGQLPIFKHSATVIEMCSAPPLDNHSAINFAWIEAIRIIRPQNSASSLDATREQLLLDTTVRAVDSQLRHTTARCFMSLEEYRSSSAELRSIYLRM